MHVSNYMATFYLFIYFLIQTEVVQTSFFFSQEELFWARLTDQTPRIFKKIGPMIERGPVGLWPNVKPNKFRLAAERGSESLVSVSLCQAPASGSFLGLCRMWATAEGGSPEVTLETSMGSFTVEVLPSFSQFTFSSAPSKPR